MIDPLGGGGPNGAAGGGERHNGGANGAGSWLSDGRWSGLRKRGKAAGWLVDPSQVWALQGQWRQVVGMATCPRVKLGRERLVNWPCGHTLSCGPWRGAGQGQCESMH